MAEPQTANWRQWINPLTALRRLYDYVVRLAERPYALTALFLVSFAESSFFPIPPDALLIPIAMAKPARALRAAAVCALGSVLGAAVGYAIGLFFYDLIGATLINYYAGADKYESVRQLYEEWNALAVAVAGFTIIPFKVFTIAAGAFKVNFAVFLVASAASRSARFFLVAGLIRYFGPGIQKIIDKYFDLLAVVFAFLLVGGFFVIRYVL